MHSNPGGTWASSGYGKPATPELDLVADDLSIHLAEGAPAGHLIAGRRFCRSRYPEGQEIEETVFIQAGGIALVLWAREKLALDCGISDDQTSGFSGVVLAHNVRSEEEVDDVMASAETAGATVTRPAAKTFYGGYAGFFTDLDGHAWEIAHNPGFPLASDGSITIPDFSKS